MASSALSLRRSFLKRPKVCKSTPNPGRCHPPPPPPDLPPRVFDIHPDELTEDAEEEVHFIFSACCEALPEGEAVTVTWTFDNGEVTNNVETTNCDEEGEAQIDLEEEIGDFTLTGKAVWSDSGEAHDTCIVHVEDPD